MRRNDEGATGSSDAAGPQSPHSQWHHGWSRLIHTRFPAVPIHAPVVLQDHCFFVDEDDPLLIAAWARTHVQCF